MAGVTFPTAEPLLCHCGSIHFSFPQKRQRLQYDDCLGGARRRTRNGANALKFGSRRWCDWRCSKRPILAADQQFVGHSSTSFRRHPDSHLFLASKVTIATALKRDMAGFSGDGGRILTQNRNLIEAMI